LLLRSMGQRTAWIFIHPYPRIVFHLPYRRHVLCRISSDGVGGPAPDEDARLPARGARVSDAERFWEWAAQKNRQSADSGGVKGRWAH
jgi:hypothetical protein